MLGRIGEVPQQNPGEGSCQGDGPKVHNIVIYPSPASGSLAGGIAVERPFRGHMADGAPVLNLHCGAQNAIGVRAKEATPRHRHEFRCIHAPPS